MTHCRDVAPFLSASLDDELSASEEAVLQQHLHTCAVCRSRVARLRSARNAFRVAAPAREDAGPRPRTPFLPPVAAAAVALAAVVTLMLAFVFRAPEAPVVPSTGDLVFMELEPPTGSEPCFYAADCGIEFAPTMP